jgi:hypothetical protein
MGSTVTVRLNKEEEKIYSRYAELINVPLSTLMKDALMEKIENEIDLKSVLEYELRVAENEVEFYTLDEAKKLLGL